MPTLEQSTVDTNSTWFKDNHDYCETQSRLECYQHIQRIVEREIRGVDELLDIGNGGFFNYDTALAKKVTAVDLFLETGPGPTPNSRFVQGSFLELPVPEKSYDCVLEQNVFHHVTGRSVKENHQSLRQCIGEMYRVLKPGGKAVIIESTVGPLFYAFEYFAFRPALWIKRGGHPVTFQFTPKQILETAESVGFKLLELSFIPRGKFLLQFGYPWPSMLTPAKPIKLILGR